MRFIKIRLHVDVVGRKWVGVIDELQAVMTLSSFHLISWIPPESGWLKGNTDETSKENPSPNFISYCIRDEHGNLVVAQGIEIKSTINLEAEALAIKECLQ